MAPRLASFFLLFFAPFLNLFAGPSIVWPLFTFSSFLWFLRLRHISTNVWDLLDSSRNSVGSRCDYIVGCRTCVVLFLSWTTLLPLLLFTRATNPRASRIGLFPLFYFLPRSSLTYLRWEAQPRKSTFGIICRARSQASWKKEPTYHWISLKTYSEAFLNIITISQVFQLDGIEAIWTIGDLWELESWRMAKDPLGGGVQCNSMRTILSIDGSPHTPPYLFSMMTSDTPNWTIFPLLACLGERKQCPGR